jgi:hypothetical protein
MKNVVFLGRVALIRTDVSEERNASIIRVILVTLMMEGLCSYEMFVLQRNIPEYGIVYHQCNMKTKEGITSRPRTYSKRLSGTVRFHWRNIINAVETSSFHNMRGISRENGLLGMN